MECSKKEFSRFYLGNNVFESGDTEYLYQIIRYFKPRRVIEIGSGFSTKIVSKALQVNKTVINMNLITFV